MNEYARDAEDEPAGPPRPDAKAAATPPSSPEQERATDHDARPVIAILNHDDELARSVSEAFEAEGWRTAFGRVPSLEGGNAEALALLEESAPDVVVFDLVQPFGEYLDALRTLRRESRGPRRPFVLTTTNKQALAKQGISKAVELREPEDVADVTEAVRRAIVSR